MKIKMEKVLFGDNQFFAVNHASDEKSRAQAIRFKDDSSIIKVLDQSIDLGIKTFMCTTHDRTCGGSTVRQKETYAIIRCNGHISQLSEEDTKISHICSRSTDERTPECNDNHRSIGQNITYRLVHIHAENLVPPTYPGIGTIIHSGHGGFNEEIKIRVPTCPALLSNEKGWNSGKNKSVTECFHGRWVIEKCV